MSSGGGGGCRTRGFGRPALDRPRLLCAPAVGADEAGAGAGPRALFPRPDPGAGGAAAGADSAAGDGVPAGRPGAVAAQPGHGAHGGRGLRVGRARGAHARARARGRWP